MLDSAAELRFDGNSILPLELPEFPWIAIMDDDWPVVFRKPQSGDERARDASTAEKDGRLPTTSCFHASSCFHVKSVQARSTASTSAATSASVCAVEMIQCRPFEGVM